MRIYFLGLLFFATLSCINNTRSSDLASTEDFPGSNAVKHFKGELTGGFKGDSIFFDVPANGKKIENLTFKGHWRCSGKIERLNGIGPEGTFDIVNGAAKGHISDPPDGGATAWRFDIDVIINGKVATGTFRMNINNPGCDTYLLKFKAYAH